jgi:hypothetical protein
LDNPSFGLAAPSVPSFRHHIFPVLLRASNSRWVHVWNSWNNLSRDWALLSDKSDPASAAQRSRWFIRLLGSTPPLEEFAMPAFLKKLFGAWRDGEFEDDFANPVLPATLTPSNLDQAALQACTGANFFPGIEASLNFRDTSLYAAPFRFSHTRVQPGDLSQVMAVPWQADFLKCRVNWWPSQRPDNVFTTANDVGVDPVSWSSGADGSHLQMVQNFGRLGFVTPVNSNGDTVHLEVDRDPTLPPRT